MEGDRIRLRRQRARGAGGQSEHPPPFASRPSKRQLVLGRSVPTARSCWRDFDLSHTLPTQSTAFGLLMARSRASSATEPSAERQFTREFKAEAGATAQQDVEAVRLDSACRLLETTNRTMEQIARTCGFGTPETMNLAFRRRLNTTPGEHRHHFRGVDGPRQQFCA